MPKTLSSKGDLKPRTGVRMINYNKHRPQKKPVNPWTSVNSLKKIGQNALKFWKEKIFGKGYGGVAYKLRDRNRKVENMAKRVNKPN